MVTILEIDSRISEFSESDPFPSGQFKPYITSSLNHERYIPGYRRPRPAGYRSLGATSGNGQRNNENIRVVETVVTPGNSRMTTELEQAIDRMRWLIADNKLYDARDHLCNSDPQMNFPEQETDNDVLFAEVIRLLPVLVEGADKAVKYSAIFGSSGDGPEEKPPYPRPDMYTDRRV